MTVIDRCNLTILEEPARKTGVEFLADHGVTVVASMPCYIEDNVDRQRGKGVFEASLRGLRRLNALGYGQPGTSPVLDLVYNPRVPACRRPRRRWSTTYKRHLGTQFGIVFNRLYALANMPIQRFGSDAGVQGPVQRLHGVAAWRPPSGQHRAGDVPQPGQRRLAGLSLRLRLQSAAGPFAARRGRPRCTSEITGDRLEDLRIRVADHCFGCTAGQGSSCGGAPPTRAARPAAPESPHNPIGSPPHLALDHTMTHSPKRRLAMLASVAALLPPALPMDGPDRAAALGVGLYQPDRKNDATYRPLAEHLARELGRPVKLYTVDTWEGLAKSLAAGETDIALMGPWGLCALANPWPAPRPSRPSSTTASLSTSRSWSRTRTPASGRSPTSRPQLRVRRQRGPRRATQIPYHHFQKNGIDPDKYPAACCTPSTGRSR